MKRMEIGMLQWLKTRMCIGWVILAMVLSVLSGCATGGKVEPELVVQEAPVTQGPTVAQLADGRKGFVITEVPQLDDRARRDFQRAVAMLNDGRYEQAVALLVKVVEQSPGVSAPYINLAIAYRRLSRYDVDNTQPKSADDDLFIEMYVTLASIPTIGQNLIGQIAFNRFTANDAPSDYWIAAMANGLYSMKGTQ